MRRVKIGIAAALLCTCAFTVASYAEESGAGVVSVDTCVNLETREQMLECYEDRVNEVLRAREADGESNEAETTALSNAPPPDEQATASSRADRRNAREIERQQLDAASEPAAASAAEESGYTAGEIIASITAIREMEPDAYLITLDNGQIWRQSASKRYLLRIGAEVRIQPSAWGSSYRLTDPDIGNYIQVKRVK